MLFKREELSALLKYKFNGEDRSFLYYHCGLTYWERVLKLVPKYVAPNLITLIGLIAMCIQTGLVVFLDPSLKGTGRSMSFASACVIWFYSTMDCIDGMQARRTGAKSPLGQLFDHGVDSVVCTCIILCVSSAVGLNSKATVLFLLSVAQSIFYWVTSKEYYTHVFYLGFIGPTEVIAMTCLFLLGVSILKGSKMPFYVSFIQNNFDRIIQSGCSVVWMVFTIFYAAEIGFTTGFEMGDRVGLLSKSVKMIPHVLFCMVQAISIFTVVLSESVEINQVFYSYIALYTVHFSLTTTLIIYSHQISSNIVIPSVLIILLCMANMFMLFMSPKKMTRYISIVSATGVCYYGMYVSNIINNYLTTLKIPFFFNNWPNIK